MDVLLIKTAKTDTFFDVRVVACKGGYINSGTEKDCVLATFSLTSASYLQFLKKLINKCICPYLIYYKMVSRFCLHFEFVFQHPPLESTPSLLKH